MIINSFFRRLENAFVEFESYVNGSDCYEYYGFRLSFIRLFEKLQETSNCSPENRQKMGAYSKLVRSFSKSHLDAFYIDRNTNARMNKDFELDCRELLFLNGKVSALLNYYSGFCVLEIVSIYDLISPDEVRVAYGNLFSGLGDGGAGVVSAPPLEVKVSTGKYKIVDKRKTDFLKILNCMYECGFIENELGRATGNKIAFLNEICLFMGEKKGNAAVLISKAKEAERETYLRPFIEIQEKGSSLFDAALEHK